VIRLRLRAAWDDLSPEGRDLAVFAVVLVVGLFVFVVTAVAP
jgi:hypothetical protein